MKINNRTDIRLHIPDDHDFLTKHFLPKKKLQSKTEINMYSTFVRNYWRTSDIFVIMTQLFFCESTMANNGFKSILKRHSYFYYICTYVYTTYLKTREFILRQLCHMYVHRKILAWTQNRARVIHKLHWQDSYIFDHLPSWHVIMIFLLNSNKNSL